MRGTRWPCPLLPTLHISQSLIENKGTYQNVVEVYKSFDSHVQSPIYKQINVNKDTYQNAIITIRVLILMSNLQSTNK